MLVFFWLIWPPQQRVGQKYWCIIACSKPSETMTFSWYFSSKSNFTQDLFWKCDMFWNTKTQDMHSSEFLRYHYYFLENVALLEVLPWKQAIKQKFLSPISNILKTRVKNAMVLFLNRVTSVLPRPFLLRKVLLCVLWQLNLPTGNTFLSLNHPNAGCIIYGCTQRDSHTHILQPTGGERRELIQLFISSGHNLKSLVCAGGSFQFGLFHNQTLLLFPLTQSWRKKLLQNRSFSRRMLLLWILYLN